MYNQLIINKVSRMHKEEKIISSINDVDKNKYQHKNNGRNFYLNTTHKNEIKIH